MMTIQVESTGDSADDNARRIVAVALQNDDVRDRLLAAAESLKNAGCDNFFLSFVRLSASEVVASVLPLAAFVDVCKVLGIAEQTPPVVNEGTPVVVFCVETKQRVDLAIVPVIPAVGIQNERLTSNVSAIFKDPAARVHVTLERNALLQRGVAIDDICLCIAEGSVVVLQKSDVHTLARRIPGGASVADSLGPLLQAFRPTGAVPVVLFTAEAAFVLSAPWGHVTEISKETN